jgi:ABC-2 type transport system ATP-binding protein
VRGATTSWAASDVIEARNLSKRFGDTLAVDRLTFDVRPGVVTGFLGPNGAGKSTTLRLILGLDRPTGGSVTVGGCEYRRLPAPMDAVGALLDANAVHGKRTARQHLRWLVQAGGLSRSRVDAVLELVGLVEAGDRRIDGFSLGMRQRLGIAAALLGDPETLLFDEPVNGLDPEGILWIRTMLRKLAAEGRTILVSSHLMSEMEEAADHVLVIGRGRLLANMSIAELTRRGSHGHVRVVTPDPELLRPLLLATSAGVEPDGDGALSVTGLAAAQIGDIAAANGIRLHELTPRSVRLEEAFMELTRESVEYRAAPPVVEEPSR